MLKSSNKSIMTNLFAGSLDQQGPAVGWSDFFYIGQLLCCALLLEDPISQISLFNVTLSLGLRKFGWFCMFLKPETGGDVFFNVLKTQK